MRYVIRLLGKTERRMQPQCCMCGHACIIMQALPAPRRSTAHSHVSHPTVHRVAQVPKLLRTANSRRTGSPLAVQVGFGLKMYVSVSNNASLHQSLQALHHSATTDHSSVACQYSTYRHRWLQRHGWVNSMCNCACCHLTLVRAKALVLKRVRDLPPRASKQ